MALLQTSAILPETNERSPLRWLDLGPPLLKHIGARALELRSTVFPGTMTYYICIAMVFAAAAIRVLTMLGLVDSIGEIPKSLDCSGSDVYSVCTFRQDMRSFLAMVLGGLFCATLQVMLGRQKTPFAEDSQTHENLPEEFQRGLSDEGPLEGANQRRPQRLAQEGLSEVAEPWQPQRLESRPPQWLQQQQQQGNLQRQWQQTRNDSIAGIAGIGAFLF